MSDFYQSKTVVTRKVHRCACCERKIPKGFTAYFQQGKCEGDFYSYYLCSTCRQLAMNYPEYVIDDWNGWIDCDTLQAYLSDNGLTRPLQLLHKLQKERPIEKTSNSR